jgi:hypothetical protein
MINKYTAYDIESLLKSRYTPPEYAFLPQVRNGTGYMNQIRTADALVMSLYPSRGLDLTGFEIKIRRSDWLSELKNPEKAEAIAQFCDFWFIVAPKDVVKVEELPSNWGLMIPHGTTTKVIKCAERLTHTDITRPFLAAILRKAQEVCTPKAELKKVREEATIEANKNTEANIKYMQTKFFELQDKIKEFHKYSGVDILATWNTSIKDIGLAVKTVLNGEDKNIQNRLRGLKATIKNLSQYIDERIKDE